ncbi:hypothetical protein HMPREF1991_01073 [Hoylesella loescheii DSM 19665 = JCM 12249 = ATCC 15930]|uniref:Uncharacterized protein n=1 Tax=Hoylesella loescheii DSM 19665 = JCM 12249 = ATCC 15930 TaxID=1122985 RepID=A0A069QJ38_HOYLO|nr:hypothetical protein HMPREF1991_01073 [Hoylesella loescheii DSM 19665 = JCM 12249 = ATCC 15930]
MLFATRCFAYRFSPTERRHPLFTPYTKRLERLHRAFSLFLGSTN